VRYRATKNVHDYLRGKVMLVIDPPEPPPKSTKSERPWGTVAGLPEEK
jgi:hypothetical protein